jgi:hypothetical protein
VSDRGYQLFSSSLGPELCRIVDMDFREYPFYALGCIVLRRVNSTSADGIMAAARGTKLS